MSETFSYPTVAAATKTLTFDARQYTDKWYTEKNQLMDETNGGAIMVKNLGSDRSTWEYTVVVPVTSVSVTDQADIESFISSTYANGAQNTFVWTDTDSTARTVRMINSSFSFEMITPTYVRISFLLRLET